MLAVRTAAKVAAIATNAASGVAALRLALELARFGETPAHTYVSTHALPGDAAA